MICREAKVVPPGEVASGHWAGENSMVARGSGGLLLCVGLLAAIPALAATPADPDGCAASAEATPQHTLGYSQGAEGILGCAVVKIAP